MTYTIEGYTIRNQGNYFLIEDIDNADPKPDISKGCFAWSQVRDNNKIIDGEYWLRKDLAEEYLGFKLEEEEEKLSIEEELESSLTLGSSKFSGDITSALASTNLETLISESINNAVTEQIQKAIVPSRTALGWVDYNELLKSKYNLSGAVKKYITSRALNLGILGSVDFLVNPNQLQDFIVQDPNLTMQFGRAGSKTKVLFVNK